MFERALFFLFYKKSVKFLAINDFFIRKREKSQLLILGRFWSKVIILKEVVMKNEVIIFENQEVKLEVNMKDETVWLSMEQISKLFGRDKSVISRHIRNVFEECEVDKTATVANFATVQKEGV